MQFVFKNISDGSEWVIDHGKYKETAVYGVKKGQVYYLKAGKTVKGVIEAGGKTSDWYKIKVTKKKKITLNFKGEGHIKVLLCNKKGKIIKEGYLSDKKMVTYDKMAKGTYYIKVARSFSTSSGYYSLKWK